MGLGLFHYQLLTHVLESIHFIYDEEMLANAILGNVSKALNAEGGSIFKIMEDNSTILPLASYGVSIAELRKIKFAVGKGVVGWVAQYGQPVKVDKPSQDQRFMGAIDTTTGFITRSILAAPILAKGKTLGVIEFLNRKDGPFAAPDLELISMVGREVGIAFENVNLIRNLEKSSAFQEAILNSLSAGVIVLDPSDNLIQINPRAADILMVQFDPRSGKPKPVSQVLSPYPALLATLKEAASAGSATLRKEFELPIAGHVRKIGYSGVPIKDNKGEALGFAFLFQDITDFSPH